MTNKIQEITQGWNPTEESSEDHRLSPRSNTDRFDLDSKICLNKLDVFPTSLWEIVVCLGSGDGFVPSRKLFVDDLYRANKIKV